MGLYAVDGQTLRKITEAPVAPWAEGVAFSRDGRTLLVQSMQDRKIEVFRWDGHKLTAGRVADDQGRRTGDFRDGNLAVVSST